MPTFTGAFVASPFPVCSFSCSRFLPGSHGSDDHPEAGERRFVVGLSALRLPPAVWNSVCVNDARAVPSLTFSGVAS
jgi:hypothetical protein